MNCLQFRRKLLEDPTRQEDDFLTHAGQCAGCRAEYLRCQAFEQELLAALQVPPPAGLREEIIHQHPGRAATGTKHRRWLLTGLAASLLLGIGIGMRLTVFAGPSLQQEVIGHIAHEMPLLEGPADHWVDNDRLRRLFTGLGGKLDGELGRVRHAGRCHMDGGDGLHLVVQGERGPVTLLLMPAQPVDGVLPLQAGEFQGVIMPLDHGSMAVVGNNGEPVMHLAERVRKSVHWHL